jgi:hypothetical protein
LPTPGCGGDDSQGDDTDGASSGPTATTPTTAVTASTATSVGDEGADGSSGSEGTTADPDTGSDTGVTNCPSSTHRCVAEPEEGWQGPVRSASSAADEAVACGGAYPESTAVAFADITAPASACDCSCEAPVGTTCANTVTLHFHGDSDACSSATPTNITLFEGICNSLQFPFPSNSHWLADPVEASGGACEPLGATATAEASFGTRVTACGGAELGSGCANGRVCAPRASSENDEGLCVWREGEHGCPNGYPERSVLFSEIEDTRDCSQCVCSPPVGLCNAATVQLWGGNTCQTLLAGVFTADGECAAGNGNGVVTARYLPGEPTAFCTPSGGEPQGDAVGTGPITLCCER